MDYRQKIIYDIEVHSVEGIVECFNNGVGPNDLYNNQPLIYELTSEYLRSPRFKDCVQAFVDFGLEFPEKELLAVLLNDAESLSKYLQNDLTLINKRYTLRTAFTPLLQGTLMHICAEFNHLNCATALAAHGADINAKAGVDENGFGGQTPVFHTVNQIHNNSLDMLNFLLHRGADLHQTVPGIIWGKTYEWETFIPSVNPISYAMMGLLPQMHRNEKVISEVVSLLMQHAYGIGYTPVNVPNKYLHQ
jgi:ankyrin repeat protein